jgi:pseudoazurin
VSINKKKQSNRDIKLGLVLVLIIIISTVVMLQKTASLVNERRVSKFETIESRIEPFGRVSIPNEGSEIVDSLEEEIESAEITPEPIILESKVVELSTGSEHTIKMLNVGPEGTMVFDPAVIKVSVGDTIHFKATDFAHNSVSVPNMIPNGATSWTGLLNEDISIQLDNEGIYVFQCDPHLMMAMIGVIQVGDAVNYEEIKQTSINFQKNFMMNADRLDDYLGRL